MIENTYTSQIIDLTDGKAKYDKAFKLLLSSKEILAFILQQAVSEYQNCTKEQVLNFIEADSIERFVPVAPDQTNAKRTNEKIQGASTESILLDEATVYFDVRFTAALPDNPQKKVKLIINIEGQGTYNPGYDIVSRGIYYSSRLISSQLTTISNGTDYSSLQKVYNIWICLSGVPRKEQNSISEYSFRKTDICGHSKEKKEGYDLISIILIRLSNKNTENRLLGMLDTLFSGSIPLQQRKQALENIYDIPMTKEIEEEVEHLCSLGEALEVRGEVRGQILTLVKLVADGNLTPDEAAQYANLTLNEFLKKVEEFNPGL